MLLAGLSWSQIEEMGGIEIYDPVHDERRKVAGDRRCEAGAHRGRARQWSLARRTREALFAVRSEDGSDRLHRGPHLLRGRKDLQAAPGAQAAFPRRRLSIRAPCAVYSRCPAGRSRRKTGNPAGRGVITGRDRRRRGRAAAVAARARTPPGAPPCARRLHRTRGRPAGSLPASDRRPCAGAGCPR